MDEKKYPHLGEYLKKNRLKTKLSVYWSGMSDFVGDIYQRSDKMDVRGTLISTERADTIEQLFEGLENTAKLLLEE